MAFTVPTHNNKLLTNEVIAIAILSAIFKYDGTDMFIMKSHNGKMIKLGGFTFSVDMDSKYDLEKVEFHNCHEKMFHETGNIYTSAGLVWKKFGKSFIQLILKENPRFASVNDDTKLIDIVYTHIGKFMVKVDTIDNGINIKNKCWVSKVINVVNTIDVYSEYQNSVFIQVVNLIEQYLKSFVTMEIIRYFDERDAERELQKEIAVFDTFNSIWLGMVDNNTNAKLVIFPENKEKTIWRIQAVPEQIFSGILKFPAPREWRGKCDFIIDNVHVTFVHENGFICGIKGSLKDAMKIAKKWIKLSK